MCTLDQARDSLHLSVCSMVVYVYQSCSTRRWLSHHSSSMFHSIHGSVVGIRQIAAAGNSVSIFLDKFVVICCLVVGVVVYVTPASRYLTYPSLHASCPFVSICLLVAYMKPANALNLKPKTLNPLTIRSCWCFVSISCFGCMLSAGPFSPFVLLDVRLHLLMLGCMLLSSPLSPSILLDVLFCVDLLLVV